MLVWLVLAASAASAGARYHHLHVNRLQEITNHTKGSKNPAEYTADYWYSQSNATLRQRLGLTQRNGPAKNLIMFLGDGMSIATITAARIYLGQLTNKSGEEQRLSFEKFPYTGLSKTYCVNSQVADSACSGTAYLTGVKNNIHTIGVTADVGYQDWKGMQNQSLYTSSLLEWAQAAGKGTGIVTTCTVTDASPTATYAHTASRYWQTDLQIQHDVPGASGVQDITTQLVEGTPGKNIKVIMGGGRQMFLPNTTDDGYGSPGARGDGKNLIEEWKSSKEALKAKGNYITNRSQLLDVDVNNTDYLLGLFHTWHMDYHLNADTTLQPTLEDMTSLAIRMMQKEANGYFLFIEGGRIDHGHHENKAHIALDETVEFHKAIELAASMTSEEDTLIVVTADHAHTMTINGYPHRGSDIFTTLQSTNNNLSYSTLSYANGPNTHRFEESGTEHNILTDDRENVNYTFPTVYRLESETHGGEDVAVYARGPCAHLLVGNYEQTLIPHVMGYAAGIGPMDKGAEMKSSAKAALASWSTIFVVVIATIHAICTHIS